METLDDTAHEPQNQTTMTEDGRTSSPTPHKKRRSWVFWVLGGLGIAVIAAGVVWLAGSASDSTTETTTELNTAAVRQTDLVVMTSLDGTLGYGEGDPITFRSSNDGVDTLPGGLSGIVTAEPTVGDYYEQGSVLYEVNDQPVVILYGDTPAYRTLNTRSSDGHDVELLEQALVDLGFDPDGDITIDEDFTFATRDAVELLQESIGAEEDGVLAIGEYAFLPGPLYVAESLVNLAQSAQSGQAVVATSAVMGSTITWLPQEGSIIEQGGVLYAVDDRPVVLFYGEAPAYRAMSLGNSGSDVEQLEKALVSLGYGDAESHLVDGVYDEQTTAAVVAWQSDIGAHTDGVVNLGEVVFLPEALRVGDVLVATGDAAQNGTPILTTSASSTFVTVQLSTSDQDLVAVGDAVVVELPDGEQVSATVTEIGTVAQANQAGDSFFEMTVTLDDPEAALGLDEAPVDVEIVSDRADGVLAVPVTALLALSEGGYAVEITTENGSTTFIGVEEGLFADGFVEVTSAQLADGMRVVVP